MPDATWHGSAIATGYSLLAMTPSPVRPSRWFIAVLLAAAFVQQGCDPVEVRIVGTFELDQETGCDGCSDQGPLTMTFSGSDDPNVTPRYRFDHADGQGHAGTYVFEAVDTTRASLVLYPDSSGPFHADLIDEVILTDYTIKAARITASCGSGIRRCLWRKQ